MEFSCYGGLHSLDARLCGRLYTVHRLVPASQCQQVEERRRLQDPLPLAFQSSSCQIGIGNQWFQSLRVLMANAVWLMVLSSFNGNWKASVQYNM